MGFPYRCTNRASGKRGYKDSGLHKKAKDRHCGFRKTYKHRMHDVECPKCGSNMLEDTSRRGYTKKENCFCGGEYGSSLSWEGPHRKGCLGCIHYIGPISLEEESCMGEE